MTYEEFREQAEALGLHVQDDAEEPLPHIIETSLAKNRKRDGEKCVFFSKMSKATQVVGTGKNFWSVLDAVLEWQKVYKRNVLDPIVRAAELMKEKQ